MRPNDTLVRLKPNKLNCEEF